MQSQHFTHYCNIFLFAAFRRTSSFFLPKDTVQTIAMSVSSKAPTALVLQVQATPIQASGFMVAERYFTDMNYDAANDQAMIWCRNLTVGSEPTAEVAALQSALPLHADVHYYMPRNQDNPTSYQQVADNGYEDSVPGAWCCAFTAQNLPDLKKVLGAFFQEYMGINMPVRDNGFVHQSQRHTFITRKNKTPQGRKWDSRYTIQFQFLGALMPPAQQFVQDMLRQHTFLVWNGTYCADVMGLYRHVHTCACRTTEEVEQKWAAFQQSRLRPMSSCVSSPYTQVREQVLGRAAETVQRQAAVANDLNHLIIAGAEALEDAGVIISRQLEDNKRQHAAPQTPPVLLTATHATRQPDTPPDFKRLRQTVSGKDIASPQNGDYNKDIASMHSTGIIANQTLNIDDMTPLRSTDDMASPLTIDEQQCFLVALDKAMNTMKENHDQIMAPLIRDEEWTKLTSIGSVKEDLSRYLTPQQDAKQVCWERSAAIGTINSICKRLQESTPLLKQCCADLAAWNADSPLVCVRTVLKVFQEAWNCDWERQKQSLVAQQQWDVLHQLTCTKRDLSLFLSDEAETWASTLNEAVQRMRDLQRFAENVSLATWPALDTAIEKLNPHPTNALEDAQSEQPCSPLPDTQIR